MKRFIVILSLTFVSFEMGLLATSPEKEPKVAIIHIKDMIDLGLAPFIERSIKTAESEGVTHLILEINTFGGRLDAAVQIRDALLNTKLETIAFINKRAISAGALISLACKKIMMTPGGTIGAATPVQMGPDQEMKSADEKVISYFRGEMKATAERRNRPAKIAEAMVDKDVVIPGLIGKGKLLTLTTNDAKKHGIADAIVETTSDILKTLGLPDVPIQEIKINWGETLVRFITNPLVSSLLLTLAFLGLFIEFKTAGFGIAGVISLLLLSLFFFGHYITQLVGLEDLLVFLVGAILLIAEIFIIPGFGIAGVLGVLCIIVGLVLSLLNTNIPLTFPDISEAIAQVGGSLLATLFLALLFIRFLPSSRLGKRLILDQDLKPAHAFESEKETFHDLINLKGIATTALRPSGNGNFNGKILSVVAMGEFIEKGQRIRIANIDGPSIQVVKIDSTLTLNSYPDNPGQG